MKKLKCLGVVAMATVLLTSCLEGGENSASGGFFGILSYESSVAKNLFFVSDQDYGYYIPALANDPNFMGDNEAVYAYITVNRDSPENADIQSKGYYTATVDPGYVKFDKYPVSSVLTDTTKALTNELTLSEAVPYNIVKNFFIMACVVPKVVNGQKNSYELSYNGAEGPKEVNGNRVYDFYVRMVKIEDGKGATSQNAQDYVYFNSQSMLKNLMNVEKMEGAENFNFRLNYAKTFNEDTTKVTAWGQSSLIRIALPKE